MQAEVSKERARAFIIMGVAGCGKSTVGKLLADRLGLRFHDGDDYHPAENLARLRAGIPLTDADRWPWYAILRRLIVSTLEKGDSLVLACSALKESYRQQLDPFRDGSVLFIWLDGDYELIESRMMARQGHFMPASLLKSQFETLEKPADALRLEVSVDPELMVDSLLHELKLTRNPHEH